MKVYEYGCLAPTANRDLVLSQMRSASRYQNKLIELERWRRAEVLKILGSDPKVAELDAAILAVEAKLEGIRAEVKQVSVKERKKTDRAESTASVLSELKALRAQRKLARKEASPLLQSAFDALDRLCNKKQIELRGQSQTYWGTYLPIEKSVAQTRTSKTPPKFKAWRGEGAVSVQIQNGILQDRVFSGKDTRVRIEPIPIDTYTLRRCDRRRGSRTTLHLRVSSDGRAPIWASFPIILHRPLPEGASIKWVRVQRRLIADHEKWVCQITFDKGISTRTPDAGNVAVNLGWRKRDDGIRAGYVGDENGVEQEIVVPLRVTERLQKCDDLRSIRDKMFDRARDLLLAYTKSIPTLPEWMREKAKYIHLWKSQRRMVAWVREWQAQLVSERNLNPDNVIVEPPVLQWLVYWYHRDRHLWQWEEHNRAKAYGHRREVFRCAAAKLASKYQRIAIGGVDLRDFATKEAPEAEEKRSPEERRQRATAAPSLLRQVLMNAFGNPNRITIAKAPYTPKCSACGTVNDVGAPLTYICKGCARTWDQDANAYRNILREACWDEPVVDPLAKPKISRTERFLAAKARKRAEAALNPPGS